MFLIVFHSRCKNKLGQMFRRRMLDILKRLKFFSGFLAVFSPIKISIFIGLSIGSRLSIHASTKGPPLHCGRFLAHHTIQHIYFGSLFFCVTVSLRGTKDFSSEKDIIGCRLYQTWLTVEHQLLPDYPSFTDCEPQISDL